MGLFFWEDGIASLFFESKWGIPVYPGKKKKTSPRAGETPNCWQRSACRRAAPNKLELRDHGKSLVIEVKLPSLSGWWFQPL